MAHTVRNADHSATVSARAAADLRDLRPRQKPAVNTQRRIERQTDRCL